MQFRDRAEAGRRLAERLTQVLAKSAPGKADGAGRLVLGLPRGGVPVAAEVARWLQAPLDVLVVRKLGVPGREELAMGAIAPGVTVVHQDAITECGVTRRELEEVLEREAVELRRREALYRAGREPLAITGRTVIVVDDGLATGSTMRAAVQTLRALHAARIIAAVPVAPLSTCDALGPEVDVLVCLETPLSFGSVGAWYRDFAPTSDDEVLACLARHPIAPGGEP